MIGLTPLMMGARTWRAARRPPSRRPGGRPRSRWRSATLIGAGASIALFATSGEAQITRRGQTVNVASAPQPILVERGWLGIGFELNVGQSRRGPTNLIVRVVRTVEGGPAGAAGIVPGMMALA